MDTPAYLWQQYFNAVQSGKLDEAQRILKKLQTFKGGSRAKGGCSSCNRRFS